jgi:hypothetical protein
MVPPLLYIVSREADKRGALLAWSYSGSSRPVPGDGVGGRRTRDTSAIEHDLTYRGCRAAGWSSDDRGRSWRGDHDWLRGAAGRCRGDTGRTALMLMDRARGRGPLGVCRTVLIKIVNRCELPHTLAWRQRLRFAAVTMSTSLGGNPDCQAPDKLAKIIKMGHPTNMDELAEIERLAAPSRNASQPSTFGDIPRLRHREIRRKLPPQAPPFWRPEMKLRTP